MSATRLLVLGLLASAALVFGSAYDTAARSVPAQGSGATASTTTAKPVVVDNFMLVDATLEAHELYQLSDAPAVVIVTQANGDAVVRGFAPQLKSLTLAYGPKGVEFLMLNSSLGDTRESILAEAKTAGYVVPILLDRYQLVGEALGVTRSAEAYVVDPSVWAVVYHGQVAGLQAALDAVMTGQPVPAATGAASGSPLAFPERRDHSQISYAEDVAPILESNCVACHSEGGIGPFAMSSYEVVKGFSPMIREVIRTDRMPPYNADPHVGKFSDSRNLSAADIKTLVHWIEAGAPRGNGADPLVAAKRVAPEWPLGTPDLVLDIPAFTVPPTGVVDYQRPAIANPSTEAKWIRASTVKPGDRRAVHHVLAGWMKDVPADARSSETRWKWLVAGYAMGSETITLPAEAGIYLPPGGAVGLQMHYTSYGKAATDSSQIGFYFHDKPPELMVRNVVVIDTSITIPANTARHRELAYVEFPNDALLYSAFPHAHYRAYSSDLWLQTPDGQKTLLLSLPRYDFNWQRDYSFAQPIKIPAGSRLIAHYVYDNSKRNPANPDPNREVTWGEQSHEEMLYTSVRFRWLDETGAKQVDSESRFAKTRLLGMMDDNIDGALQKGELKGRLGNTLRAGFDRLDTNNDQRLDQDELEVARAIGASRRRG